MKHGRKPTRKQQEIIKRWHLNPHNWLVCMAMPKEMHLEHRHTGSRRLLPEGMNGKQELRKEANA